MQLMPAHHFDTIKVRHIWFTTKWYGKGYQTIFIYLTVSTLSLMPTFTPGLYVYFSLPK